MPPILVLLKEPEASGFDFSRLTAESGIAVRHATSLADALPWLASTEIMVTLGPHLGADAAAVFAHAPRLRWVQLIGTGTDNVAEHLPTHVALTRARGLHGRQMSEAALGAMLALARQLPRARRNQDAHRWDRYPAQLLAGRTVGILGVGTIAATLAPLCKAFGMRVIGISEAPRPVADFDAMRARRDLPAAVADLDHLVLLAPYSAATHHLIGAEVFAAMKPDAMLINLARGGIVDEAALLAALDAGEIAGAALDVFETEPLPASSPLWDHPRLIITPHIAGLHTGYADDVVALMADNLRRFLADGPAALINRVEGRERLQHAVCQNAL